MHRFLFALAVMFVAALVPLHAVDPDKPAREFEQSLGDLREGLEPWEEERLSPTEAGRERYGIDPAEWTHVVEMPVPDRFGQQQPPTAACVWLPEGVETIRGLFWGGGIIIGKKLVISGHVRQALARMQMGAFFFPRGDFGPRLATALEQLAARSGHPELPFVPFATIGHSADGIFARNIGYIMPERTIAVVMVKSGNFHHHIPDLEATLAGIPLIHIPGEFEEYGPEGGDMGSGLRSIYTTEPFSGPVRRKNQTQWVCTRQQMLERRRKNPDNIWSLVVHRGGSHTTWSNDLTDLVITYLEACIKARLPVLDGVPSQIVRCKPLTAADGWLYDADIKKPEHEPAPYASYTGNKQHAFWAPDNEVAMAIWAYHQSRPWSHPDPTRGMPIEERYYPEDLLKDLIDSPPPPVQVWTGGDGAWTRESATWAIDGQATAFDPRHQVAFTQGKATVTVPKNISATGITVGSGTTLDLGQNRIRSLWHAEFAAGSVLKIELNQKSPASAGRRGAVVVVDGTATLGADILVTIEKDLVVGQRKGLREGEYALFTAKGRRKGDFARVTLPPPLTGKWLGNTYCAIVPYVPTEAEKKRAEQKKEQQFDNAGVGGQIDMLLEGEIE